MHPGVEARFASNGGLITRAEALDLGLSPSAIQALVRRGAWVVVRRGVYADAQVWSELDDFRARPRLRAHAALLKMTRGWVLSHDSAAHELGLDILAPSDPLVHVTRPGFTDAWTRFGVKHHLARYGPAQVQDVGGRPVLDAGRTAVDIARERGVMHGLVACDSAMRTGTSRTALWEAVAPMSYWPGVTASRTCIELADPGAQTVGESLSRHLIEELGIGRVETQFPVATDRGVFWCDLRVGNHVFEFDGHLKYRRAGHGGVAQRPIDEVLWEEKERQRLVCAEGLGMSRIIWSDFWAGRRAAARSRLLAEYAVTVDRFGTGLSARLAANAREIRDGRSA